MNSMQLLYGAITEPLLVLKNSQIIYANEAAKCFFGYKIPPNPFPDAIVAGKAFGHVLKEGHLVRTLLSVGYIPSLDCYTVLLGSESRFTSEFLQLECLGSGGFGSVFKCVNILDKQTYAVKKVELKQNAYTERLNEVKTLAAVSHHPHVVRYYNAWVENAHPNPESLATLYIQMKYYPYTDLRRWIRDRKCVDQEANWNIVRQLVNALMHIHSHNIIHRDVKPENIFMNEMHVYLGDFGLARNVSQDAKTKLHKSDSKSLVNKGAGAATPSSEDGTYIYTSPEIRTSNQFTPKADIFSLGIILYELFCPFSTEMERLLTLEKRTIPADLELQYPLAFQLVKELTASDPLDRPSLEEISMRILPPRKSWTWHLHSSDVDSEEETVVYGGSPSLHTLESERVSFLEERVKYLQGRVSELELERASATKLNLEYH